MLIKQLSIFLENRQGRFCDVATLLGEADVNMTAFTVSENSDFGIVRLIVSNPEEAYALLKEKRYAVSVTDVICIQMPNKAGALAKVMNIISAAGVFVEYMYAFSSGDAALCIIRPDNIDKTVEVLSANKVELLAASELFAL